MSDFLARMAVESSRRLSEARALRSEAELRARVADRDPPKGLRRGPDGFDLIAEVKRRSPSEGALRGAGGSVMTLGERAASYAAAGAAAISVLTEESEFGGSLRDLAAVAGSVDVPVMRKDFLVDPFQVLEAREAGAGGVLLIARMLSDGVLEDMLGLARTLGMFVLLEAFDGEDLERLSRSGAGSAEDVLLGLNSRDLMSLTVDPGRFARLAPAFPSGSVRVAESGLREPEEVAEVARAGYDMALVGSALMRSRNPQELVEAMIQAGRAARRNECAPG